MTRRFDVAVISIALVGVLMIFPYMLPTDGQILQVRKYFSILEHLLIGIPLFGLLAGSFFAGRYFAGRGASSSFEYLPYLSKAPATFALWLSYFVTAGGLMYALGAYLSGGFQEARELGSIEGIGVIYRVYYVALPILAVLERDTRKIIFHIAVIGVLQIGRAAIFSERIALVHFLVIAAICLHWQGVKIPKWQVVGAVAASVVFFVAQHYVRLAAFGDNVLVQSAGPIQELYDTFATYYADVQNKAYLSIFSDFRYPVNLTAQPISALIGERFDQGDMETFFFTVAGNVNFLSSALNNVGGISSDVSDFGVALGLLWAMAKFTLAGYVTYTPRIGLYRAALYCCFIVQIAEYPRGNFLQVPFAAYLVVAGLMLAAATRMTARSRNAMMRDAGGL